MIIRTETSHDQAAIHEMHLSAFGQEAEAELVDLLREAGAHQVSLVADYGEEIAGHILFSPVTIEVNPGNVSISGLAPLGVAPAFHSLGVGSSLVREGLAACENAGIHAVVVLGDPGYYQRFGFTRADLIGLKCEYDAPPECFMVKELVPHSLDGCSGVVHYHPVFHIVE